MKLLEAIVEANHAAAEGRSGEVDLSRFSEQLPLAALTCIDPRLNALFPGALALNEDQFIWLRGAGNVITSPNSSTVRSVALAIYLNLAKEIAVIGHTDCRTRQLTMSDLLSRMQANGIDRNAMNVPNLQEFFGLFSSETQNVIKGVGYLRESPFIPKKTPVHGLLINTQSGRLDWVVNGYETLGQPYGAQSQAAPSPNMSSSLSNLVGKMEPLVAPQWEAITTKIGSEHGSLAALAKKTEPYLTKKLEQIAQDIEVPAAPPTPPPLPPIIDPVAAAKKRLLGRAKFQWPEK